VKVAERTVAGRDPPAGLLHFIFTSEVNIHASPVGKVVRTEGMKSFVRIEGWNWITQALRLRIGELLSFIIAPASG
jgi:hypothetical protein